MVDSEGRVTSERVIRGGGGKDAVQECYQFIG